MSVPEKYIREFAKKMQLDFRGHAVKRMGERCISTSQVAACIQYGKVLEHQYNSEDVKILFQENTKREPAFYVIVAASTPYPVVVSVVRFKEEAWEYVDGFMKRREKKC